MAVDLADSSVFVAEDFNWSSRPEYFSRQWMTIATQLAKNKKIS